MPEGALLAHTLRKDVDVDGPLFAEPGQRNSSGQIIVGGSRSAVGPGGVPVRAHTGDDVTGLHLLTRLGPVEIQEGAATVLTANAKHRDARCPAGPVLLSSLVWPSAHATPASGGAPVGFVKPRSTDGLGRGP